MFRFLKMWWASGDGLYGYENGNEIIPGVPLELQFSIGIIF